MNKKIIKRISLGLGALVLIVTGFIGVSSVKAQSSFWDTVAQVAGKVLGDRIQIPDTLPLGEESLGAAGDTESTSKIAQVQFSGSGLTFEASGPTSYKTTLFSILNSSSRDRVIDTNYLYLNGNTISASSTVPDARLVVATSTTTSIGSNTNFVWQDNAIASTTATTYVASSTPGTVNVNNTNRIWKAGSYLVGAVNLIGTTTPATGYFRVNYSNLNP